jgi:CheY-like chemotaxis protein
MENQSNVSNIVSARRPLDQLPQIVVNQSGSTETQFRPNIKMKHVNILLVAFDRKARSHIQEILEQVYTVCIVSTVFEALTLIQDQSVQEQSVDLVLLNTVQPGIDDVYFLQTLRDNPVMQDLPIIVVGTESAGATYRLKARPGEGFRRIE